MFTALCSYTCRLVICYGHTYDISIAYYTVYQTIPLYLRLYTKVLHSIRDKSINWPILLGGLCIR